MIGLLVLLRGCDTTAPPALPRQITVAQLPAATRTVRALFMDARFTQPTPQVVTAARTTSETRLQVTEPSGLAHDQRVAAGAFDDKNCLLAVGELPGLWRATSLRRRPLGRPSLRALWSVGSAHADVFPGCGGGHPPPSENYFELSTLRAPDCRDLAVRLSEGPAAPTPSGSFVTLRGFGFQTGAKLFVAGRELSAQTGEWEMLSQVELSFRIPSGTAPGKLTVQIQNPDGTSDSRDDLVSIPSS